MTRRRIGPAAHRFDIEAASTFSARSSRARTRWSHATEHQLDRFTWRGEEQDEDAEDDRRLEPLAHPLGAAKEAVSAAVTAGNEIAAEAAKHRVCARRLRHRRRDARINSGHSWVGCSDGHANASS